MAAAVIKCMDGFERSSYGSKSTSAVACSSMCEHLCECALGSSTRPALGTETSGGRKMIIKRGSGACRSISVALAVLGVSAVAIALVVASLPQLKVIVLFENPSPVFL